MAGYTYEFDAKGLSAMNLLIQGLRQLGLLEDDLGKARAKAAGDTRASTNAASESAKAHKSLLNAVASVDVVTKRYGDTIKTVKTEKDKDKAIIRETTTLKEKLANTIKTTTTILDGEKNVLKQHTSEVDKAQRSWSQWLSDLAHGGQIFQSLKSGFDTIKNAVMGAISPIMQYGTALDMSQTKLSILAGKSFPALTRQVEILSRKYGMTRTELLNSQASLLRGGLSPTATQTLIPQIAELHEQGLGEPEAIAAGVGAGFGKLSQALILPTRETVRLKAALRELGIGFNELKGMIENPTKMLEKLGGAIAKIPEDAKKVAIVKRIFGDAWEAMMPFLTGFKGGNAPINQTFEELKAAVIRVYESLSRLLKTPILAFFGAIEKVVSQVEARIAGMAEKFGSAKMTLSQWIEVVKEVILTIVAEVQKASKPIWDALVTPATIETMKNFGKEIGNAVVDGMLWGIQEAASRIPDALIPALESRSVRKLKAAVQQDLAAEAATHGGGTVPLPMKTMARSLPKLFTPSGHLERDEGEGTPALTVQHQMAVIDQQIKLTTKNLRGLGNTPEESSVRTAIMGQLLTLTTQRRELGGQLGEKDLTERLGRSQFNPEFEELETTYQVSKQAAAKQVALEKTMQLVEAEKKQKEALEQSNAVLAQTNIAINTAGGAFAQWLLNPINKFKEMLLEIKDKFGELLDTLSKKRIDLAEKFGLKSPQQATADRTKLTEAAIQRDERLLKLAQSPEEQAKIQERLADRAASLAEGAKGSAKTQFGTKADQYLAQSEESLKRAEELRVRAVEIQQQTARENLAEYEKQVAGAQTAGGKAAYLEQLKEAYQQFGPDYQEQAIRTQQEWKQSKAAAGAEDSLNAKRTADAAEMNITFSKQIVEQLQKLVGVGFMRQMPPDPGYAAA
jgi:hypothetical protein